MSRLSQSPRQTSKTKAKKKTPNHYNLLWLWADRFLCVASAWQFCSSESWLRLFWHFHSFPLKYWSHTLKRSHTYLFKWMNYCHHLRPGNDNMYRLTELPGHQHGAKDHMTHPEACSKNSTTHRAAFEILFFPTSLGHCLLFFTWL